MPILRNPVTPPITLGIHRNPQIGLSEALMTPAIGEVTMHAGSLGNYGWPRPPKFENVGGPFSLETDYVHWDFQNPGPVMRKDQPWWTYDGSWTAFRPRKPFLPSTSDGSSRGAEAFAKMKPTRPSMRLLTSIYELKDLPMMLRQRMSDNGLRDIGSYFLAYKFGWEPLLKDIRDMILQQKKIEKRIDFLLRNHNKTVRTNIELANYSTEVDSSYVGPGGGTMLPILVSQFYKTLPDSRIVTRSGERLWASARWRIFLPSGPGSIAYKRALMAELYGLYPSPSTIWKMMPWSWLIDWFSNAGYLIENLESTMDSRIAAEYCYVMRHHWATRTNTCRVELIAAGGSPVTVTSTCQRDVEYKTRIKGNPFGFSTNMNLSGMQLAILGALGLSRL